MTRPVLDRNTSVRPFSFRESQYWLVLRHCQTMALHTGSPVFLSQTMVVSRWLVMPMAAILPAVMPRLAMASLATSIMVANISLASCSTQPGLGKYWVNSFCATEHISPASLNRMQRLEVVPASSAMIYFSITSLPELGYLYLITNPAGMQASCPFSDFLFTIALLFTVCSQFGIIFIVNTL